MVVGCRLQCSRAHKVAAYQPKPLVHHRPVPRLLRVFKLCSNFPEHKVAAFSPAKTTGSPCNDLPDEPVDDDDGFSTTCDSNGMDDGTELPPVPMRPLKVRRCEGDAWIQLAKDVQAIDSRIGKGNFAMRYPVPTSFRQGPCKDGGYINRDGLLVLPHTGHDGEPGTLAARRGQCTVR